MADEITRQNLNVHEQCHEMCKCESQVRERVYDWAYHRATLHVYVKALVLLSQQYYSIIIKKDKNYAIARIRLLSFVSKRTSEKCNYMHWQIWLLTVCWQIQIGFLKLPSAGSWVSALNLSAEHDLQPRELTWLCRAARLRVFD